MDDLAAHRGGWAPAPAELTDGIDRWWVGSHDDQAYVTGVEGCPGVVVHGPLLVLELPRRSLRAVR